MYNRTGVAKAVPCFQFLLPAQDGFKPASRQKMRGHENYDQGRWMGLHAFQGTGSNSYTSAFPVLIVCHKLPNLSTINDKELQCFTDRTQG